MGKMNMAMKKAKKIIWKKRKGNFKIYKVRTVKNKRMKMMRMLKLVRKESRKMKSKILEN